MIYPVTFKDFYNLSHIASKLDGFIIFGGWDIYP